MEEQQSCYWYNDQVKELSEKLYLPDKYDQIIKNKNAYDNSFINGNYPMDLKIRKNDDKHEIIYKKSVLLTLKESKINKINKWFDHCRYVNNLCVDLYINKEFSIDSIKKNNIYNVNIPDDIVNDIIEKFDISKNIIKKNNNTGINLLIPYKEITSSGFYNKFLGKNKNLRKDVIIKKILSDCSIYQNKYDNNFYLYIPEYGIRIGERDPLIAVDPGEKIFLSYYSLRTHGFLGKVMVEETERIIKKINNIKDKTKSTKKIRKKINKNEDKIQRIVDDFHSQISCYLCSNYEKVLIPNFTFNKIQTDDNFILNKVAHEKFLIILKTKAKLYNTEIIIVDEYYTSSCCSKCGYISKKYIKRDKICLKCDYKINRDINAARNILLKNWNFIKE